MKRIEKVGCILTDQDNQVLLRRYQVMPDTNAIYEIPGSVVPTGEDAAVALSNSMRQEYKLHVIPCESVGRIVRKELGSLALCKMYRAELLSLGFGQLDDDEWRYVDLRQSKKLNWEIELGPYAEILRRKIQNGQIEL
jgi:hypothetical protein